MRQAGEGREGREEKGGSGGWVKEGKEREGGKVKKGREREREEKRGQWLQCWNTFQILVDRQNKRRTKDNVLIFNPPMYGWI